MSSRFMYGCRIKKSRDFIVLCMVFLLIFLLESMYFKEETSASVRGSISLGVITLYFFMVHKERINRNVLFALFILLSVRCLNWIFYGINFEFDIYNIVMWIIAALLITSMSFEQFSKAYIKVLSTVGIVSSILFAIRLIRPNLLYYLPTYSGWHETSIFANAILGICDLSSNNLRNFGVFYEPGLHGIFQCIALYFLLFREKKIKILYLVCISLGIFSSLSTNGIISAFILVLAYVFNNKTISRKQKQNILLCLFASIVFLIIYLCRNPQAFSFLIDKFSEISVSGTRFINSTDTGSGYERVRSVVYSASLLFVNPLFGCGWPVFLDKFKNIIATFTPFNWLCIYGWPVGLLLNYYLIKYELKNKRNIISKILLIIFQITLIVTQNLYNDIIIIILILYNVKNI